MRAWTVAGGLIERDGALLLVQNRRRDGSLDWTTPGGVVDQGEELLDALTREVVEETGLRVAEWHGPVWEVEAHAPDMGWTLRVEVHRAVRFTGQVVIDDPDGIVVDASFATGDQLAERLASAWVPAREPMLDWLGDPWTEPRTYRYRLDGLSRADAHVTRLQ